MKAVAYDEKVVPSRIAGEYTKFGWVRGRKKISEHYDRKTKGTVLTRSDDKLVVEAVRRKKRFGYNAELCRLEKEYFSLFDWVEVHSGKQGRGLGFIWFLAILFLVLTVACAVIAFVPKEQKTVAAVENSAKSGIQKVFNDIGKAINTSLFYGDQYYVLDSDVNKDAGETGTIVTVPNDVTNVYRINEDGQLVNVQLDGLKEKLTLDEDGNIQVLRCEKAFWDPSDEATAYYRYYIYYDYDKAPLGFAAKVTAGFPAPLATGMTFFILIALVLFLIFFIWAIAWGCHIGSIRSRIQSSIEKMKEIEHRAGRITKAMKEEDPALMGRAQRHAYSWQNVMVGAINMSNAGKNDNVGVGEDDEFDDFGL